MAVGYALNLAVATLLVSGLFIAAGSLVEDERERVIRSELNVVGEQLVADLSSADALVRTDPQSDVTLERDLPEKVAGVTYTIEVRTDELELRTNSPDVTVTVPFAVADSITVVTGTVSGGDLEVVYTPGPGELEVKDA